MADVERGYGAARALTANAGRTYYLASLLLPRSRQRAVHALYGFARLVDDAVDSGLPPAVACARVDDLEAGLAAALSDASWPATIRPVDRDLLAALAESVREHSIPTSTFTDFFSSMRMDLPGSAEFCNRFHSFADLAEYTRGSAAAIGVQLIPVLGADPALTDGAALLGEAFQLTNFLRDVAEDLRRDRIYLPLDELAVFGVDEASLRADLVRGQSSAPLRHTVAHLIAINRAQYRLAAPAISALPRQSRPAIAAAARSYSAILAEIEARDLDVMSGRAVVPIRRRLGHAVAALTGPGRLGS